MKKSKFGVHADEEDIMEDESDSSEHSDDESEIEIIDEEEEIEDLPRNKNVTITRTNLMFDQVINNQDNAERRLRSSSGHNTVIEKVDSNTSLQPRISPSMQRANDENVNLKLGTQLRRTSRRSTQIINYQDDVVDLRE